MPIEIEDCDGGIGNIIESRGMVRIKNLSIICKVISRRTKENLKNTNIFFLITQP